MTPRGTGAMALALATLVGAGPANAEAPPAPASRVALDQFNPAPAGDAFFGVSSPFAAGHLVPRAIVMLDHADQPLRLSAGSTRGALVSSQTFLHINASLALFDRLLLSALVPIAVSQRSAIPPAQANTFSAPPSSAIGDLRLGARVRLFGDLAAPLQLGVGAYVYAPTSPVGSYAGDGAVRFEPHIALGGRVSWVVWTAAIGFMAHGSTSPSSLTYGAGAAVSLLQGRVEIGPEFFASTPVQVGFLKLSGTLATGRGMLSNVELLLGARARVVSGLVLGAAIGPGLTDAIGTPSFRVIGSLGWSPLAQRRADAAKPSLDTDEDGIPDASDACRYAHGPANPDARRNGCPVQDRDKDGAPDEKDACPDVAGDDDRGCPIDKDGDGVPDAIDACPDEKGPASADGCAPKPSTTPAPQ